VQSFLPEIVQVSAVHREEPLEQQALDGFDHVIVLLPTGMADWPDFPHAGELRQLFDRLADTGDASVLSTVLANASRTSVSLGFCKIAGDTFTMRSAARRVAAPALHQRCARVAAIAPGFPPATAARALRCVVSALALGAAPMPTRKRDDDKSRPGEALREIVTWGACPLNHYRRELAEAQGNGLARWLAALPSNELTVAGYLDRIEVLAARAGWECTVLGEAELAREGAHAFLAVARGSRGHAESSPALVRLQYRPGRSLPVGRPDLCLVGKGICFDTGGVNVKPVQYMQGMNEDMQGSAVALGTLLAITQLALPFRVDVWLALAENAIGPAAYKPQDVITAANGTTIEIIHTDAEGRMVLADTLHLAARERPALMVDLATLTGACVNALTTSYSGVFTNRPELRDLLLDAGRMSGERVWPFPMDEDFDQALDSDIADIKQCAVEGRGDHILAARFLQRFVPEEIPWVHVDLAASRHKGGLADVPTDVTGFGVRFLMDLLVDQVLVESTA
jgi:leucyl aminopeptidase